MAACPPGDDGLLATPGKVNYNDSHLDFITRFHAWSRVSAAAAACAAAPLRLSSLRRPYPVHADRGIDPCKDLAPALAESGIGDLRQGLATLGNGDRP